MVKDEKINNSIGVCIISVYALTTVIKLSLQFDNNYIFYQLMSLMNQYTFEISDVQNTLIIDLDHQMIKYQANELNVMSKDYHVEIGHRAKGLIDMSEIRLHVIVLSIITEELDIMPRNWIL